MYGNIWPRLAPLQLTNRPEDPLSNRVAAQVARLEHGVRPHCGLDGELEFRKPFGFPNK